MNECIARFAEGELMRISDWLSREEKKCALLKRYLKMLYSKVAVKARTSKKIGQAQMLVSKHLQQHMATSSFVKACNLLFAERVFSKTMERILDKRIREFWAHQLQIKQLRTLMMTLQNLRCC